MEWIRRSSASRSAVRRLFKPDHPRGIDRYIDYFGGVAGQARRPEASGEHLLDGVDAGEFLAAVGPQAAAG